MMDSARARTVGSSSTTRTVVGLACFIGPTPLALKTATMGEKRSSNFSQSFQNFDSICCTYAAETRTRKRSRLQPEVHDLIDALENVLGAAYFRSPSRCTRYV